MKVSSLAGADGDMGPRNTFGFAMNNAAQKVGNNELYFFGDIRGNENPGVVMYHILFIREHNRQARRFAALDKTLTDEQLWELGRKWVRAEFQAISETQYFPLIVGPNAVPPYTGYKVDTDPSVMSPFSTACFRYGHSEGNEIFYRLDENRNVIPQGNALMENVFFDNRWADFGIGALARGMAIQRQQAVDIFIISPLRNFLYGQPGAGGTDLVVRNLQRGRDHGMGPLNAVRNAYGLPSYTQFEQITKSPEVVASLKGVYLNDINDIDLYAGLAEDIVPGANLGPTFQAVIRDQYVRVRDGDRFWWNQPGKMFTDAELAEIKSLTLSKLVLLNTDIKAYPCNPFVASNVNNCDRNGVIDPNANAASSIVFAPVVVALLAIFAMMF
jgi:peroxidase